MLFSCQTPVPVTEKPKEFISTYDDPLEVGEGRKGWFAGTFEEAKVKASQENKNIFLYWGAVWCPPCNELKQEVFATHRFQELMLNFIPLYLDGDSEQAQELGATLNLTGYPTVVIFDAGGQEMMRLQESISIQEFDLMISNILTSNSNFKKIVKNVLEDRASSSDWLLLSETRWGDDLDEKTYFKIYEKLKSQNEIIQTKILTQILNYVFEHQELGQKIIAQKNYLLETIFKSDETIFAARNLIVYQTSEFYDVFYQGAVQNEKDELEKKWMTASSKLVEHPSVSLDIRLWSYYPEVIFYKKTHPKKNLPKNMIKKVKDAVANINKLAKTPFQRKSVISNASYLLTEMELYDDAEKILTDELKVTSTPWYLQSSLSQIEKSRGNMGKSLEWSQKARASVKGKASRVQWIVADLKNQSEFIKNHPSQKDSLVQLAKEYYDTVFTLSDGFSGRNELRGQWAVESLKPWKKNETIRALITTYQRKCSEHNASSFKEKCQEHFSQYEK